MPACRSRRDGQPTGSARADGHGGPDPDHELQPGRPRSPDLALALAARLLIGIGTGLGFIAGSAYVRSKSGSAFAQGIYGGVALGGGGLALAIVPAAAAWIGWRAPS